MVSEIGKKKAPLSLAEKTGSSVGPDLWADFFRGDRLACARLITAVENHPELIPEIRDRLIPRRKGAIRIGITGPPGVGKSTVTAALARRSLKERHAVGIIAVDPSSPFTGGAFLGDRVRMAGLGGDHNIFIRSLASRDGRGGLSPSTPHVADVLDAFGMDRIFIETVGVGQDEMDILTCADLIILVLQPGTGDVIQALKAGILEAADIFLVNKADLPGTENLLDSLRFMFDISARQPRKSIPPLLAAAAVLDRGLDDVYQEMEQRVRDLVQSGTYLEKRRALMEREIRFSIQQELWERFAELTNAEEEIRAIAGKLLADRKSPYPYIRQMCSRIRIQKAKGRAEREKNR